MSFPRPFPLDDAVRGARRDAAAGDVAAADAPARRTWPVLARIGELGNETEPPAKTAKKSPLATRRSYRVDSPHVTAATPPEASSLERAGSHETAGETQAPAQRSERYLHRLPGVIRFAIRTWLMLHPYRSLIRTAAMLVVMAVSGASTVIMMGGHLQPDSAPPNTTSAATEQPVPTETATGHGELGPMVEPVAPPEASTTTVGPTASGPTGMVRQELVAVETEPVKDEQPLVGEVVAPPIVVYPTTVYPTTSYPTTSYPTTPYPAPSFETAESVAMPHVQTTEPSPEVARFEGTIQRASPR